VLKLLAFLFSFVAVVASAAPTKPEYPTMGADIFDAKAPAGKLIADAVAQATREDKKVLLLFGANWCPWCRRLHRALTQDPSIQARLNQKFVFVHIDVNTRNEKNRNADVLAKYGNPVERFGLPVFIVLDKTGSQLTTRETASLTGGTDREVAAHILEFLGQWSN
jgi:thioredoxin-related protein